AKSAEDRVPQDTAPAGPPVLDHPRVQVARDEVRDLVLEALFLIVRKRQVEGVGANSELGGRPWRARRERDGPGSEEQGSRELGPRRNHRAPCWRSEEHTSELQSRFDLVCRLLLEKKNSGSV